MFLLGESHGIAANEELDFALLRYLHRTAGVRVYFAEISHAQACLLNRYLESGDDDLLAFVFGELRNTPLGTREHREFIRQFRAWNSTLDPGDRVRIEGVDVEFQPRIAMRFLSDLVQRTGHPVPAALDWLPARLRFFRDHPLETGADFGEELLPSIREHRADYARWFGDGLVDVEVVAANLRREVWADREPTMYAGFLRLYPRYAGKVCYGRWGADHIVQRPVHEREPLATLMNRPESPVHGRIVSIQPIYEQSRGIVSDGQFYRTYVASAPALFRAPFVSPAGASVTLFRIEAARSLLKLAIPAYPLAEGVQYVVLIREARPAHPI